MKTRTFLNLLSISLLAAWVLTGCDNAADTDTANDLASRTQTVDLDDPYGGFNTADEKPYFGDAMLADEYAAGSDVAVDDDVDTTRTDPRRARRFLMITWGNLRADSLIDFSTDWSGGLCADNAVVVVKRLIRFDPLDHLLPRTSRECVEWVSHTRPHFDGILVELLPPRCDSLATPDAPCARPLSVTFKTGPLTVTIDENELKDLHRVVTVDDAGNAVAFNTIMRMPGDCPSGFLAGRWLPVESDRIDGRFRGQWVSESGLHMGYLHGIYGLNRRGDPVFFGKWIDENGRFEGLLKGRYGLLPASSTSRAEGWFDGMWFSRELAVRGGLAGAWGTGDGDEAGYFRGRWIARCR
ncbi:MAG TPA: hypothetical protein VFX92_12700 [Candidatus Krumholzibacteria bacterium]|nr:hypothetical protein [Candidatus Krumholzibacteria bacterium]